MTALTGLCQMLWSHALGPDLGHLYRMELVVQYAFTGNERSTGL